MSTPQSEQQRLLNIIFSSWPNITELDKKVIEIAITNPPQFISLIGEDAMISAKTCLLRQEKKSLGHIAFRLELPKQTVYSIVRRNCAKCAPDDEETN